MNSIQARTLAEEMRIAVAIGDIPESDVVARLEAAEPTEALAIACALAPALGDAALCESARIGARRQLRLAAIQEDLVERGLIEAALVWPAASTGVHLLSRVARSARRDGVVAWLERGADALEARSRDFDSDALTLLERGSVLLPWVAAARRREVCDRLEERFRRERDQGRYDELDYAYGQVDPQISLAATLLSAGERSRAWAHLDERHAACPRAMHVEELEMCASMLDSLDASTVPVLLARVEGWARAADDGVVGAHLIRWWSLAREADPPRIDALLVEAATDDAPAPTICGVWFTPGLPLGVKAGWLSCAVSRLEQACHAVADTPAGHQPRAHVVRTIRSCAGLLAQARDHLTSRDHARVSVAVARWARWALTHDGSDWAPHVQICVALATGWRTEIEPVLPRFAALARAERLSLRSCRGWEVLYSPAVVRSLIGAGSGLR